MTTLDWTKYLKVEPRTYAEYNGWGIYTLSHNECVGECLTRESAEYYAKHIADELYGGNNPWNKKET